MLAGSVPPDQVVVVVDRNPAWVRRLAGLFEDPRVIVVESQGAGWAAARNTGLAWSVGDIVAFLHDDSTADSEWLGRLADALTDGRVVAAANTEAFYPGGVRPLAGELQWLVGATRAELPESGHAEQVLGVGAAFRRNALVDAGGFPSASWSHANRILVDHLAAAHGEDALIYVPNAIVNQFVAERSGRWSVLVRAGWRYGRGPVSATALHGRALRYLARRRTREAAQCAVTGLAVGLGTLLRFEWFTAPSRLQRRGAGRGPQLSRPGPGVIFIGQGDKRSD